MKTIIAGSRDFNYPRNLELVTEAVEKCGWKEKITEIVSGCARGIDTAASIYANRNSIHLKKMPADWSSHSRRAGFDRNLSMAEYADALIAIWDKKSPGTKHMIDVARAKKLKVYVLLTSPPKTGMFEIDV